MHNKVDRVKMRSIVLFPTVKPILCCDGHGADGFELLSNDMRAKTPPANDRSVIPR